MRIKSIIKKAFDEFVFRLKVMFIFLSTLAIVSFIGYEAYRHIHMFHQFIDNSLAFFFIAFILMPSLGFGMMFYGNKNRL